LNIKCLYGGCPKEFTPEEVRTFVDSELFMKYQKFYRNQYINNLKSKYIYHCPFPNCEEVFDLETYMEDTFVECDNKHKSCTKCKTMGWHQAGKCKQV
jgi:hypothetical protein